MFGIQRNKVLDDLLEILMNLGQTSFWGFKGYF